MIDAQLDIGHPEIQPANGGPSVTSPVRTQFSGDLAENLLDLGELADLPDAPPGSQNMNEFLRLQTGFPEKIPPVSGLPNVLPQIQDQPDIDLVQMNVPLDTGSIARARLLDMNDLGLLGTNLFRNNESLMVMNEAPKADQCSTPGASERTLGVRERRLEERKARVKERKRNDDGLRQTALDFQPIAVDVEEGESILDRAESKRVSSTAFLPVPRREIVSTQTSSASISDNRSADHRRTSSTSRHNSTHSSKDSSQEIH